MRLFELTQLQEAHEYLDTDIYGSWIDTITNKIIPVPRSHHLYLLKRYKDILSQYSGIPENTDVPDEFYQTAYNDGLVRIVHEFGPFLEIQGTLNGIKKAWKFIRPTAMKKSSIFIDFSDSETGFKQFNLPKDKAKLIQFMQKS